MKFSLWSFTLKRPTTSCDHSSQKQHLETLKTRRIIMWKVEILARGRTISMS
ncbi:hypothetical protein MA16_Dca001646 [Dendrobium catenatum]|uniref:Uncharacterized protein n=1 Tax=Dendrobium catenatum TaxID=906689 RepID=A0A2I0WN00_9ASPA|nr:hypothetical protein MA16_Dca001646 [Dendrobium catenatum]